MNFPTRFNFLRSALMFSAGVTVAWAQVPESTFVPLEIGETASMPTQMWPLAWLFGAVALALATWTIFAFVRAERSDATYTQRRAHRKLIRHLQGITQRPSAAGLEKWCELTGELFGVPRAAPTLRDLRAGVATVHGVTVSQEIWTTLWQEARQALFAENRPVPADWVERARKAAAGTEVKRVSSRWPDQGVHWLPRVAMMVILGCVCSPEVLRADQAADAWAKGEHAVAQEAWRARLRQDPGDWAAQRNLAFAYQADDLWGPATAHWTAAFVLNPREPSIASAMQLVTEKMDGIDPSLRRIVTGKWYERLVGVLSPGEWQWLIRLGAVLLAMGLLAAVISLYQHVGCLRCVAWWVSAVGALVFLAGVIAVHRYGVLAHPDAACITRVSDLRSVPSELVEQEKSAPLLAGQIVTIEGHYFGWCRIIVRGGSVGWVRRAAVLPLYQSQSERGATGFDRSGQMQ